MLAGTTPYNYNFPWTTNNLVPAISGVRVNPASYLFPWIYIFILPGNGVELEPALIDPARTHILCATILI